MTYGSRSHVDLSQIFDVLVIGGGNAALCAAMTAREAGAGVLLLECAPKDFRGGNSRHTRNLRYLHEHGNDYLTGPYGEEEFWDDLMRVTQGQTTEQLARFTIRKSKGRGAMDGEAWLPFSAGNARHPPSGKNQRLFPRRG